MKLNNSRILDAEAGASGDFLTEKGGEVGDSGVDELRNEGKKSWIIDLGVIIHFLAPSQQAQAQNHNGAKPPFLRAPRHVI